MHGAYGRVRNGGNGGTSSAPRLVIGFALVMALAAFLSWSTSPPPSPSAKRLASNSDLVRGTIGQAENMGSLLGAASTDVVANAKAAALQDPLANAGAGKGINEGAADITHGMALFDGSSARAAGPIPSKTLASSAAAAGIRGSSVSNRTAATAVHGIADAVAAGQAGGFQLAGKAASAQLAAAQKKQSGALASSVAAAASGTSAVKQKAADLPAKVAVAAGGLKAAAADSSKAAGNAIQGAVKRTAAAGSASVSDKGGSARNVDETADTDYADAGLDVDGDGLDNILTDNAEGNGAASKDQAKDAAAAGRGAAGAAGSRAGSMRAGGDAKAAGGDSAGIAAGTTVGSKTSPENELVIQNAGAGGAAKVAGSNQGGGSMQLPQGVDTALE